MRHKYNAKKTTVAQSFQEVGFFVPGIPRPGGSKRAFFNKRSGKAMVVETGKYTKDWRNTIAIVAHTAFKGRSLLTGPLELTVMFYMPRPACHYGTGKNKDVLKEGAPSYHTSAPDTTKLLRALEDALTGVIWRDDAQIAVQYGHKLYAKNAGADVIIKPLD